MWDKTPREIKIASLRKLIISNIKNPTMKIKKIKKIEWVNVLCVLFLKVQSIIKSESGSKLPNNNTIQAVLVKSVPLKTSNNFPKVQPPIRWPNANMCLLILIILKDLWNKTFLILIKGSDLC